MSISASLVKELRERTGAGMMECKKELVKAKGDIEAAIENMRKSGQAKADKKAGRTAAEGIIENLLSDDNKHAVIIDANCETDFVARGDDFRNFVKKVAEIALENKINDVTALLDADYADGESIDKARKALIAKIGENINLRRVTYMSTTHRLGSYVHGGRIGVLVEMENADAELAKDIAMHIAASNPVVVTPEEVPQEKIEKEREIFAAQAAQSDKPQEIVDKMVEGRIKKFINEVSLLGQPFVKDLSFTVAKLLEDKNAKVVRFIRYEVGEGIEKSKTDFTREVMEQVKGTN